MTPSLKFNQHCSPCFFIFIIKCGHLPPPALILNWAKLIHAEAVENIAKLNITSGKSPRQDNRRVQRVYCPKIGSVIMDSHVLFVQSDKQTKIWLCIARNKIWIWDVAVLYLWNSFIHFANYVDKNLFNWENQSHWDFILIYQSPSLKSNTNIFSVMGYLSSGN